MRDETFSILHSSFSILHSLLKFLNQNGLSSLTGLSPPRFPGQDNPDTIPGKLFLARITPTLFLLTHARKVENSDLFNVGKTFHITYLKGIIEKVWLASTISSGIFLETKQSRGFSIITAQSGSTCNRNRTLCNSKATFDPEFRRCLRKK